MLWIDIGCGESHAFLFIYKNALIEDKFGLKSFRYILLMLVDMILLWWHKHIEYVENITAFSCFSAVIMAARSLVQLYRKTNPELLHRKDRVSISVV